MKAKWVTSLLLVVALVVFLGGCCYRAVKEAPPPPPPPPNLESVYFDFDKATLTAEAQATLQRNIEVLNAHPDIKVCIQGNACALGNDQYNQMLSERRAAAVEAFLIKGGISADRLSKVGYGATQLQMPEPNPNRIQSDAAKANRRVDLKVVE